MENQVLTIEQMKHLKELGCDTSRATVYWVRRGHGCDLKDDSKGKWFVSLQKDFMVVGFTSYEVIPTFTLHDILYLLPPQLSVIETESFAKKLVTDGIGATCTLSIHKDREFCTVGYTNTQHYIQIGMGWTFQQAAYNALCYLFKNGIIK